MKKIILLFLVATLGVAANSQITKSPIQLAKGQYVWNFTGVVGDTAGVTSTFVLPVYVDGNNGEKLTADIEVKLKESVAATGQTDVMLWGKIFLADTYTALDTIRYYGTGTDTTIKFQYTTANRYNIWAIQTKKVTGTNRPYILTAKGYFKK